ncbi:MAG: PEP/pyruvate-binding domain-containing protein [Anaerolineales bacterium]
MTFPTSHSDQATRIYLALAQYPILQTHIRERMRQAMFDAGVITPKQFEAEVRKRALQSQKREGLDDPFGEETTEMWEVRLSRVRDTLTDFYFGYNLPFERFEKIVKQALSDTQTGLQEFSVSFNPELAPIEMLFDHAQAIAKLPPQQAKEQTPRLQEIIVVLIRKIISDHLAYVNIAKEWFEIQDLIDIQRRKIGYGKIGGKAAGMLLAYRIMRTVGGEEITSLLDIPVSYYLGAGVMYTFMSYNNLMHWHNQKYKPAEDIYADYPQIIEEYERGELPLDIERRLRKLLANIGQEPIIVRSSSLLEDNFGTSFAGKYESVFCPNQGSLDENYHDLVRAIARVYASAVNPDALLYRRKQGLLDYDERLAILIQIVEGERFGPYHLPHTSGVGFSRNLFRWTPKIDWEAGFLRLVWGLGTRAVERVGDDYPRLVSLSHPFLRPETSVKEIRHYTQHYVDLINLETNRKETRPVNEVLTARYPPLRYLAEVDEGEYLSAIRSIPMGRDPEDFVLTFNGLLRKTGFGEHMRTILSTLETHYKGPVDTEFTASISPEGELTITLLQCRPQSHSELVEVEIPDDIDREKVIFSSYRMIPRGKVENIRYILFVPPANYFAIPTRAERLSLGRAIGRVNARLADESFICIGPGRWGTNNPDLGIHVSYSDIYHTKALIELSGKDIGMESDPSFGTHFFQDLVEANIFPLAVFLDDEPTTFEEDFFYQSENVLPDFMPQETRFTEVLHLIDVTHEAPGHLLTLLMSDTQNEAIAYLKPISEKKE